MILSYKVYLISYKKKMDKIIKTGIIDRFEKGVGEDFAIIELDNKEILIINKNQLPVALKEGDKVNLNQDNIII